MSPKMILRGMRLDSEEAKEAVRTGEIQASTKRKYTFMQLDEAVRVAKEVGPLEAQRITGVNKESIKKHAIRQRKAAGEVIPRGRSEKYPAETKRKVLVDAMRYRKFTNDPWDECFDRAAVNNGLDKKAGASIRIQYQQGTFS